MVTWVQFRDLQTGRLLYCFNTHFDHRKQGARERSAGLVAERIAGIAQDEPVILLGDFNSAAGPGRVYDTLVGASRLADTWTTAARRGPAIGTFHNYAGPREGASRIDWILTRGPLACRATEVVTFSANGQYPSDHFPVVATLEWEPAAPVPATP
jgi:endonuclease/exonuclease/phosphatase family metal-dependent hydrolase